MRLPERLLEKLVCPGCKGKLEYIQEENRLICKACNLGFRIVDDIPILLLDEADKIK